MKKRSEDQPVMRLWCDCAPSQNARLHHMARYRMNKAIKEAVGWQIAAAPDRLKQDLKAPVKRHIKVTRFYGGKAKIMDSHDNLPSCAKPAIDALKLNGGSGVIIDDSTEWCCVEYHQEKSSDKDVQGKLKIEVWK